MTTTADPDSSWYYDLKTGEVTQGRQRSWTRRMGPYPTAEAASRALETARERNEAWDAEDAEDD